MIFQFKQLLTILLLILFAGNWTTAQINIIDGNEAPGIAPVVYDIDTVPAHTIDDYVWVTEKVLWYDPFSYSFQTDWESTLIADKDAMNLETNITYNLSQVDRMPIYSKGCLRAEDPRKCSNDKIEDMIREHIEYPEKALRNGHDGLEYVFFVVDETGRVEGNYQVLSKEEPCTVCSKAAVDAVANLDNENNWQPAMKNGKPVRTRLSIPVRFMYID